MRILIVLLLLLSVPVWCQDQAEVVRNWTGYAVHREVFSRYFTVNATPDWWVFLTTKKDRGYTLINLTNGILDMAPGLEWADAKTIDGNFNSTGDAPAVLEALDSWKGKVGVTVNLPGGLDDAKKEQVMVNYELLGGVVGWKATCLPRGGKFFLTVSASPKVSEAKGNVSKDGNTYEVVLPTSVGITSGQLEEIFKKGMK